MNPTASSLPMSSSLPVGDWLLVEKAGYVPLGQVMGVTVFQATAGWTGGVRSNAAHLEALDIGKSYEIAAVTRSISSAARLTLERLFHHAAALGAHLVAGVSLERIYPSNDSNSPAFEFKATGTALRETGMPPAQPILSNLRGAEIWQLRNAGYQPMGIALGNCHWLHVMDERSCEITTFSGGYGGQSAELPDVTKANYQARSLAISRLQREATASGADGVLGITVVNDLNYTLTPSIGVPFVWHFFAMGTSITGPHKIASLPINAAVSLTDSGLTGNLT